jgi:hypothetical protein
MGHRAGLSHNFVKELAAYQSGNEIAGRPGGAAADFPGITEFFGDFTQDFGKNRKRPAVHAPVNAGNYVFPFIQKNYFYANRSNVNTEINLFQPILLKSKLD